MKRTVLFALLLVLLLTGACGQMSNSESNQKTKRERIGWDRGTLYGDVVSVTIIKYETGGSSSSNDGDREVEERLSYKFNRQGDVVSAPYYEESIESEEYLGGSTIYEYGLPGGFVLAVSCRADGSLGEKTKYDLNGNKIEVIHYDPDGSQTFKTLYKYDPNGNMIEEAVYNSDGSLDYKYLCKYDSNGNVIEKARYDGEGSLGDKFIYKYDLNGNLVEWNRQGYYSMMEPEKYSAQYDAQGNRIREVWCYQVGPPEIENRYEYDSNGNLIKAIENGEQTHYKYDSKGNRVAVVAEDGTKLIEYKIVYRE